MRIGYDGGFFDIRGLSTETKPSGSLIINADGANQDRRYARQVNMGDTFYEIDTKALYMFDGTQWQVQ